MTDDVEPSLQPVIGSAADWSPRQFRTGGERQLGGGSFLRAREVELVDWLWFRTGAEAKAALVEYTAAFYHSRRHSSLGCYGPDEYAKQADAAERYVGRLEADQFCGRLTVGRPRGVLQEQSLKAEEVRGI